MPMPTRTKKEFVGPWIPPRFRSTLHLVSSLESRITRHDPDSWEGVALILNGWCASARAV